MGELHLIKSGPHCQSITAFDIKLYIFWWYAIIVQHAFLWYLVYSLKLKIWAMFSAFSFNFMSIYEFNYEIWIKVKKKYFISSYDN